MTDELELAAMVHYSFLPDDYEDDRLRIAVTMRPCIRSAAIIAVSCHWIITGS